MRTQKLESLDSRPDTQSLRATKVFTMQEIGAMLRKRRKELGYTQEWVADMMGCSPRLVGELERGRATVGIQRVIDYANGLGIDFFLKKRG